MRAFIFFTALTLSTVGAYTDSEHWCQRALKAESAKTPTEAFLLSAKIVNIRPLKEAHIEDGKFPSGTTTELYLIEYENGMKAVFKPEKYLWSSLGEIASYNISKWFGMDLVPTTVLREIGGKIGSVQLYIENDYMSDEVGWGGRRDIYNNLDHETKNLLAIFHYFSGNWDRHYENIIVDFEGRVWAIDNEIAMSELYWKPDDFPFVQKGRVIEEEKLAEKRSSFPFDSSVTLKPEGTNEENIEVNFRDLLSSHLGRYLSAERIEDRIQWSKNKNWSPIEYVIWNGTSWLKRTQKSMGPPNIVHLPRAIAKKIEALNYDKLREILPARFTDEQIEQILFRRHSLLELQ